MGLTLLLNPIPVAIFFSKEPGFSMDGEKATTGNLPTPVCWFAFWEKSTPRALVVVMTLLRLSLGKVRKN
jgi:hypothetical protein